MRILSAAEVSRFVTLNLISMNRRTCKHEPLSVAAPIETAPEVVKYDDTTEMEWREAASLGPLGPRHTESGSAGGRQPGGGGFEGKTGDVRTVRIDDKGGMVCS